MLKNTYMVLREDVCLEYSVPFFLGDNSHMRTVMFPFVTYESI